MKVQGWHVDGFGVHHDLHVDDLPDGLTIVTGHNEAGKTTLQHFLIGMLFGFSAKHRPDHHAPLNGGNYGGRLIVTDGRGEARTIHRSAARSSLRITSPTGDLPDGELTAMLGGASKDLYQSIFGVHLADLAELRALTEDEVRDRVFSAGVLGAGRTAQQALAQLSTARDLLYKPGGRDRKDPYRLKALHAELIEARAELSEAQRRALGLPELVHRSAALTQEAEALAAQADDLHARRGLLSAVTELWPTWVEGQAAQQELAALGSLPPADTTAAAELPTAAGLHHERTHALATAQAELARTTQVAAEATPAGPALSHVEEITALRAEVTAERTRRDHVAELTARVDALTAELDHELASLGPTCDLAWLQQHTPRVEAAAELRTTAAAATSARQQAGHAAETAARLHDEVAAEAAALHAAEAQLGSATGPSVRSSLQALDHATTLVALTNQRGVCAERLAALGTPSGPLARPAGSVPPWAAATGIGGLATLALVARLGGFADSSVVTVVTVAGVLLVALAGAVALASRRPRRTTVQPAAGATEFLTEELQRIDGEIDAIATKLRLPTHPTAAQAASVRATAERLANEAQRQAHERTAVADRRATHEARAQQRLALADQRVAQTAAARDEAEAQWTSWLQRNHLPATLDPEGASQFLAAVHNAHKAAANLRDATASRERALHASNLLDQRVTAVAAALGLSADPDPLTTIARLAELADAAVQADRHQAEVHAAAQRAAAAVATSQQQVDQSGAALDALLARLGARDVDHALAIVAQHQAAQELLATIRRAQAAFDAAIGTLPSRVAQAHELLAAADPTTWTVQLRDLQTDLTQLTEARDQIVQERAGVEAELHELSASADVPTRELRVTDLEAQLVDGVTEWASLTLAHRMIEGTLARYQRERQPDVVKRAAALFQQITDGRYTRLEIRDNEVVAINRSEQEVPAASLSQGTVEQLYLCMRFALAESFSATAALPLLLDDITVNADQRRLPRLAQMIATVATTQQVFVFTCQDSMVQLLQQTDPSARVIDLDAPGTGTNTVGLAAG